MAKTTQRRWRAMCRRVLQTGVLATLVCLPFPVAAATLPPGFAEVPVASGLSGPTAMEFAPDGRLFVAQQGGSLRVIKGGSLLATPFITLTVDSSGERGLLGIAFDPNFATNHFIYLYYTSPTPAPHNRLSRFTANGDVALAGSEVVLLDLNNLSSATNHNGGATHFGIDGKIYIGVGENANGANSQDKTNLLGKMLRINSDGSIPPDNPFIGSTIGKNQAIWAMGLRNPFTFAIQPGTGRIFIDDVGQSAWEEIDDGIAGSNYGWPHSEGNVGLLAGDRAPLYAYPHSGSPVSGCAITGGTFYNPAVPQFPASYFGKYFFSDLCSGWIKVFDPATATVTDFASGISNPVDLKTGPAGTLFYLANGSGQVYEITQSSFVLSKISSRKQHGAAGNFDLPLAQNPLDPTTEPRTTGDQTFSIVFTFNRALASGDATVTEGSALAGTPVFNGSEMIVPLTGVMDGEYVTVVVSNVTSTVGDAGGAGSVRVGFLAGNVTQTRKVLPSDAGVIRSHLLETVAPFNFLFNVSASGQILPSDVSIARSAQLHSLPAP